MLEASVIVPTATARAICGRARVAGRPGRRPRRATRCWSWTTGPRPATRDVAEQVAAAHRRADRLCRARGRARAELRAQHRHRGGRAPTSSCSSTTTSRRRRAGCASWSTAAAATPSTSSSEARSGCGSRDRGFACAAARRRRSRRSTTGFRTARSSSSGARTWRSTAARSSSPGSSTPASPTGSTRTCGSGGCAPRAGASSTSRAPGSSTAAIASDARLGRLLREAYRRGRNLRAYSEHAGHAPSLARRAARAGRLRLPHLPLPLRQRHPAHGALGRPRARVRSRADERRGRSRPTLDVDRLLSGESGIVHRPARAGARARLQDLLDDAALWARLVPPRLERAARAAAPAARCSCSASTRPTCAAIDGASGARSCAQQPRTCAFALGALDERGAARSRAHTVASGLRGGGKFENLNALLERRRPATPTGSS